MEMIPKPKTCDDMRKIVAEFLKTSSGAHQFWEIITGLRGPDSPSELDNMPSDVYAKAYDARRKRKAKTVEVIRGKAFFGVSSGSARVRHDRDYVVVPKKHQDHFDKHVVRAAEALGLEVKYED